MVTTDIIVILYGDRNDYDRLVDSIGKNCVDYNLITIDNNTENLGFSKAVNEGIRKGSAPYFWLLNQDAIIKDKETQQALIDRFSYGSKVGIVGSMQIDPTDHDVIKHGGTSRAFPGGVHKGGRLSMGHCQIPEKQTWVNFASVMVKRGILEKTGLLDESMFLLYSDSSFCYTARQAGWECWYEPRSQVYHKLNVSKGITEWHKKDMEAFMEKWGITATKEGFVYSPELARLDMFP